ncbi:hypothetical protein, partial [Lysinibacillus sphaericus]|uniref:hypothetical protein n=1 Tax=Lysinibacillus sphaericus TaxID=1421 RepID=UPI001E5604CF
KRLIGHPLERTLAERKSTLRLSKWLFLPLTSPFFNNTKGITERVCDAFSFLFIIATVHNVID